MKMYGHRAFILVLAMNFVSCDTNVSLTTKNVDFDPKLHVHAIGKDEKLPEGVRGLLNQQPHSSQSAVKFPVSYYLLQEPDAKFIYTKDFEPRIRDQLIFIVSGEKYYKLFVHPDSDRMYSFLRRSYRYIGPDETEFVGSPITGDKTLVIWNSKNYYRKPFVVKTILDAQMLDDIRTRFPAQTIDPPEMASLLFKREIKGTSEKIEGQQVTEIPRLP